MGSARRFETKFLVGLATLALAVPFARGAAGGTLPDYPELFDPFSVPQLEMELTVADWDTIRYDLTFDIEVPAQFWAEGEDPILVSVRRKSSTGLPDEVDPLKVGLKIDINEYVDGQVWHGQKKLSLENGADGGVVTEGFAWMLHRRASQIDLWNYRPGLANWVELSISLSDDDPDLGVISQGVYANVEQPDKTFMQHRDYYAGGVDAWLYEIDDVQGWALEEGDPHSPAFDALCFAPFEALTCSTPDAATLAATVQEWVNVENLFSLGAVESFTGNSDALFSHSKNFNFSDFAPAAEGVSVPPRVFHPWDLDTGFRGSDTDRSIYDVAKNGNGDDYEQLILINPTLQPVYEEVFCELLAGPLQLPGLQKDLDDIETAIGAALAADPLAGEAAGSFAALGNWIAERIPNVYSQLPECAAIFRDNFERGDSVNWSGTTN